MQDQKPKLQHGRVYYDYTKAKLQKTQKHLTGTQCALDFGFIFLNEHHHFQMQMQPHSGLAVKRKIQTKRCKIGYEIINQQKIH